MAKLAPLVAQLILGSNYRIPGISYI
ncbi:hypothetical protein WwAna0255, partial [Wolbachia endosymbiont of Drosophila ananassae]